MGFLLCALPPTLRFLTPRQSKPEMVSLAAPRPTMLQGCHWFSPLDFCSVWPLSSYCSHRYYTMRGITVSWFETLHGTCEVAERPWRQSRCLRTFGSPRQ